LRWLSGRFCWFDLSFNDLRVGHHKHRRHFDCFARRPPLRARRGETAGERDNEHPELVSQHPHIAPQLMVSRAAEGINQIRELQKLPQSLDRGLEASEGEVIVLAS
jgi:hypothetical protein